MFSRNPNDPAQITIRLANERVVLEAPKLREHIAGLIAFVNDERENLAEVKERSNSGKDYAELREHIVTELTEKLKPTVKASATLLKIAKRASVYVREPLAAIDSALHQMQGTINSLKEERLATFRAQYELIAQSLAGLLASFDGLVTTAKYEKNRTLFGGDVVCMFGMAFCFAALSFIMAYCGVSVIESAKDSLLSWAEIQRYVPALFMAAVLGGLTVLCTGAGIKGMIAYFRATTPNFSADEECGATA